MLFFFLLCSDHIPTHFLPSLPRYLVVIVGHSNCGGAQACLSASSSEDPTVTVPSLPPTDPLNKWLAPLTRLAASLQVSSASPSEALSLVVEENVKMQVERLAKTPTITDVWANKSGKGKEVWIHGWVYELATGKLKDLGVSRGPSGLSTR